MDKFEAEHSLLKEISNTIIKHGMQLSYIADGNERMLKILERLDKRIDKHDIAIGKIETKLKLALGVVLAAGIPGIAALKFLV